MGVVIMFNIHSSWDGGHVTIAYLLVLFQLRGEQ